MPFQDDIAIIIERVWIRKVVRQLQSFIAISKIEICLSVWNHDLKENIIFADIAIKVKLL